MRRGERRISFQGLDLDLLRLLSLFHLEFYFGEKLKENFHNLFWLDFDSSLSS